MIIINCPKCGNKVKINISNAIDEFGEVYNCPTCHYMFRYTEK